jgi:hypothetical protein
VTGCKEPARAPWAGWWMLGAFVPSLLLALGTLIILGAAAPGTIFALRLTARWAYLFFWLAYAGGALATLFGPRLVPLARRGRALGLAFAAAMLPHAALVAWIYYISQKPPASRATLVYFGIGLVIVYLLALLSVRSVAARLPPTLSRGIRLVGAEYIALAFLRDFLHVPAHAGALQWLAYLPFIALAAAAALLRLGQWWVRARA